jgi:hypothetical protein
MDSLTSLLYAVVTYTLAKIMNQFFGITRNLPGFRGRVSCREAQGDFPGALGIVAAGPCRDSLQAIFNEQGWILRIADTPQSAIASLRDERFPIIFYQRGLDRDWSAEVSRLSKLSPRPAVVLLSEIADGNLWDELGRNGGFHILRMPISRAEAIRIVRAGWSLWRNQQKLRSRAFRS